MNIRLLSELHRGDRVTIRADTGATMTGELITLLPHVRGARFKIDGYSEPLDVWGTEFKNGWKVIEKI